MCILALSLISKGEKNVFSVHVGPTVPLLACEIQPRSLASSLWIPAFMLYLWQRLRACTEPHVTHASDGLTTRTDAYGATAQTNKRAN